MASASKPARNRLRRSCDVCFKSKTKCDDHRPCNSCIRRKCEDRCVVSGQSADMGPNAGMLDGIQRAATTPFDRGTGSEAQNPSAISPYDSPSNGSSSKTQPRNGSGSGSGTGNVNGNVNGNSNGNGNGNGNLNLNGDIFSNWDRNQSPYQTWGHRRSYSLEEATARDLLGLREQANLYSQRAAKDAAMEHVWSSDAPHEGRTHFTWLLRKFADVVPHIDDDLRHVKRHKPNSSFPSSEQFRNGHQSDRDGASNQRTVFEETPSREDCTRLINLFFDNYAQVFPVIQQNEFERSYYIAMSSPETFTANNSFAVLLLLVLLLGNTLLDPSRQLIAPETMSRWLEMAFQWQNTTLQNGPFNWEQIRMLVLVNIARQVTKVNVAADWIATGSAVRAAMTSGFHKSQSLLFGSGHTAHVLWTALVELDLQTSLAAGMLPTTATPTTPVDSIIGMKDPLMSSNSMWNGLASIMSLRRDILNKLNGELRIKHQDAIQVARELTNNVGSLLKSGRKPENSFAFEYLAFVYRRYMFALHRPFAILDDPAFHFSRRVCTSLSLTHIERLCRLDYTPHQQQHHYHHQNHHHQPQPQHNIKPRTPFENLLTSYTGMFWDEAFQSVMFLSHSLLRTQSVEDEIMDTIMLGDDLNGYDTHGISTTAIRRAVERFVPIAERNLNGSWTSEQCYLVPAVTLAYLDLVKQYPSTSTTTNVAAAAATTATATTSATAVGGGVGGDTNVNNTTTTSSTKDAGESWAKALEEAQQRLVQRCVNLG